MYSTHKGLFEVLFTLSCRHLEDTAWIEWGEEWRFSFLLCWLNEGFSRVEETVTSYDRLTHPHRSTGATSRLTSISMVQANLCLQVMPGLYLYCSMRSQKNPTFFLSNFSNNCLLSLTVLSNFFDNPFLSGIWRTGCTTCHNIFSEDLPR